jgi:hypothetical protein
MITHDDVLPSSTAREGHSQFVKLSGSHDIARSFNVRCPQKQSGLKNAHIDAGKFSNLYSRFTGLVLQTIWPQLAVNCHAAFQAFSTNYRTRASTSTDIPKRTQNIKPI